MRSKTLQTTEARIRSGFGWGLTQRIESHGMAKFKSHLQRVGDQSLDIFFLLLTSLQSRDGVSLILNLLRQSRLQPMTLGGPTPLSESSPVPHASYATNDADKCARSTKNTWSKVKSWLYPTA